METFAPARRFVENATYGRDRDRALATLDIGDIDAPIRSLVLDFRRFSHCFTLQCCYGHFLHDVQEDPHNAERLQPQGLGPIQYRIAYLALCIEDSAPGRRLCSSLEEVTELDPAYIQFGSPEWFWERQVNSYALQVEPERLKDRDVTTIDYQEAIRLQEVRDLFFQRIGEIVKTGPRDAGAAFRPRMSARDDG